jgi:hypothetical protein
MCPHIRISLKPISVPLIGWASISAPPVLNPTDHTTDYCCCKCDTVLMHAERGTVFGPTIRCTICGSFNTTNL